VAGECGHVRTANATVLSITTHFRDSSNMSFTLAGATSPLASPAVTISVVRYSATPLGQMGPLSPFQLLANVVCEDIQVREGPEPGTARFRYILNDSIPSLPYPDGFEDLYPLGTPISPWVVQNDDRLLVYATDTLGNSTIIFDGFAQIPEVSLSDQSQIVTFMCIGVAIRLWDTPTPGAVYQNASSPTAMTNNYQTDLPTRFNPNDNGIAQPNSTPAGFSLDGSGNGTGNYPIFLDPAIARNPDPRTFWTLAEAVQYLIWTNNADQTYVQNGNTNGYTNYLQSITPTNGSTYDPLDTTTYTATPIVLREYDASNKAWPEAVAELVNAYGFRLNFVLSQSNVGGSLPTPVTTLQISRRDGMTGNLLAIGLQEQGAILSPGFSSVGQLGITRNLSEVWNSIEIETDPVQYEVSVILAPGFQIGLFDPSDTNKKLFLRSTWTADTSQVNKDKYRLFIFDECADGHWDFPTGTWQSFDPDLTSILSTNAQGQPPADGTRTYVSRYRPTQLPLLSIGSDGKPMRARLDISRNYTGVSPGIWNGKGSWQPITGGWTLLKDRLGIFVDVEDIESWSIGAYWQWSSNPGPPEPPMVEQSGSTWVTST
jgi:hypothetical protein